MHTSLFHCMKNHRILYVSSGKTNSINFLTLFRLGSDPSSFHKVDENSNSCHKEVELEDYNLSRQHLNNGRVQGRVIDTKRYSHFSPPELGLCYQLQEVCVRPMPCVGISGIGNIFSEYEGGTSQV